MKEYFRDCAKCEVNFPETELELSHDVPCYIFEGKNRRERKNHADKFGRHYLCKKCHDIYEKTIFSIICSVLSSSDKERMITRAKDFARDYFKEEKENGLLH